MKAFIHRFPKLTWFLIGLAVAIPICLTSGYYADKTIKEYQSINKLVIDEYKHKTVEQSSKIESLTTENSKLKQKTKTYKIIKPDGTVEERSESEVESEQQLTQSVKEEYYLKLQEETRKIHEEYSSKLEKITSERKKLNVEAGITHQLDYYLSSSYNIYGPVTIGAGLVYPNAVYSIGVGIDL